jgi:hypothetical protein
MPIRMKNAVIVQSFEATAIQIEEASPLPFFIDRKCVMLVTMVLS